MANLKKYTGWVLILTLLMGCVWGCGGWETPREKLPQEPISAVPWPEADQLFRQDPGWLGADDAYSIDLKDGRILWLFGDSFISTARDALRSKAVIIRNSVGIQTGRDPSRAAMRFYWRSEDGPPQSFFPENGKSWFWPGNGIRIGSKLVLFLMAVDRADNALGFQLSGWCAVVIDQIQGAPPGWRFTPPEIQANPFGTILGVGSVILRGAHVYAFGYRPDSGAVYLVRWRVSSVVAGEFCCPQWWVNPPGRWVSTTALDHAPSPLFNQGQSEFSVHFEPALRRYVQIQTIGFGAADIGWRSAAQLTGPWSPLQPFYSPEEQRLDHVLIYAAKVHPHLHHGNTVLTYVANSLIYEEVIENRGLYYPRFLKVRF